MVTSLVIDNSAIASLFLIDEDASYAKKVLSSASQLRAPSLIIAEFGNAMVNAIRRQRLTHEESLNALKKFARLPLELIDHAQTANISYIYLLAHKHTLTFYDAIYLSLALNQNATLASLDKKLLAAARAESIEIFA